MILTCDDDDVGWSTRIVGSIISVVCLFSKVNRLRFVEGSIDDVRLSPIVGLIIGTVSFVPNKGNEDVRIFKLSFWKMKHIREE